MSTTSDASRGQADVNAIVAGYLRDLAFAQPSQPQMFGYKRAANSILALETSLTDLIREDGGLPRIAGIGPGSACQRQPVAGRRRLDSCDDFLPRVW